MFYTPDTLTVSEGQTISGRLSCAPNARNPRDLDIKIAYQVEDGPETEIQYKMCVPLSFLCLVLWTTVTALYGTWDTKETNFDLLQDKHTVLIEGC